MSSWCIDEAWVSISPVLHANIIMTLQYWYIPKGRHDGWRQSRQMNRQGGIHDNQGHTAFTFSFVYNPTLLLEEKGVCVKWYQRWTIKIHRESENRRNTQNQGSTCVCVTMVHHFLTKHLKSYQDRYAHFGIRVLPRTILNTKFGKRGVSIQITTYKWKVALSTTTELWTTTKQIFGM